jgi:hypothetical protein
MTRVEEIVAVRVAPGQAMRALATVARFADWVAPHITVTALSARPTLGPGDRFRLEVLGGTRFEYQVEAATDREMVFAFAGPWSGRERWSFIADGAETLVRRVYDVDDSSGLAALAWQTVGRALVAAHFKLELARFRAAAERDPGPRAEIEARPTPAAPGPAAPPPYPVDEG